MVETAKDALAKLAELSESASSLGGDRQGLVWCGYWTDPMIQEAKI